MPKCISDKSLQDIKLNPIKYAVVGYGGMAEFHQNRLNNLGLFDIKGVYDKDYIRAEHAAWQGLIIYNSIQEIATDDEIEVVFVNVPSACDGEIVTSLIQHRKHIFCEKHVAVDPHKWDAMVNLAQEYKTIFVLNHNRRLDRDYCIVQDIIKSDTLGSVYKLTTNVSSCHGVFKTWMQSNSTYGGLMLDWGMHLIDQLLMLDKSPVSIVGCCLSHILGFDAEDGFELDLAFGSGLQAKVVVDTNSFVRQPRWQLWGTKGSAIIYDWDCNGEIVLSRNKNYEIIGTQVGNAYSKTMSPRNPSSLIHLPLPQPKVDQDEYYKRLAINVRNNRLCTSDNPTIKRVLNIMLASLKLGQSR